MFLILLCCLIFFCSFLHVWAIKGSYFDLFPLDSLHLATPLCSDELRLSHLSFLTVQCSPLLPGPWAQGMVHTVAPCLIPGGGPQLLRGHYIQGTSVGWDLCTSFWWQKPCEQTGRSACPWALISMLWSVWKIFLETELVQSYYEHRHNPYG